MGMLYYSFVTEMEYIHVITYSIYKIFIQFVLFDNLFIDRAGGLETGLKTKEIKKKKWYIVSFYKLFLQDCCNFKPKNRFYVHSFTSINK